eukprot:359805-Rhodomonas_salina.2
MHDPFGPVSSAPGARDKDARLFAQLVLLSVGERCQMDAVIARLLLQSGCLLAQILDGIKLNVNSDATQELIPVAYILNHLEIRAAEVYQSARPGLGE